MGMNRAFYIQVVVSIVFSAALLAANNAMAACAAPVANTGALEYFTGTDEFKFCDGTNWLSLPAGTTLAACTNTGGIEWDATEKAYKFCDSANYQTWGCTTGVCVQNGLVSHWKLDETSGTLVDSVGSNDGTATNTPTYNATGKVDGAMQFDGTSNEHVLVSHDASLDFDTTSFSYGGWFYPTAFPEAYSIPFHKGGSTGTLDGYDIEFSRPADDDSAVACQADGTSLMCTPFMSGAPALNTWHHLFVVTDQTADEVRTYHNGVLYDTNDISGMGGYGNTEDLQMGIGDGGSWDYQGRSDDLRVYDRALSAAEVFALYDCQETSDITSNLQGHWALDESAGTNANDETANGYDGTLYGNPTWNSTGGAIGGAADFDGTDDEIYLDVVSPNTNLHIDGDLTIAAWVKTSVSNASGAMILLQDTIATDNNYNLNLMSGSPRFDHGDGAGGGEAFSATATVNDDSWHHVAFVADFVDNTTNDGFFYIDGVFDSSVNLTFDIGNIDASDFKISTTGSTYSFDGLIDDVRIYDRALSAADMKALFETGTPDTTSNLQGHWKFDETSGTSTNDETANNNDGTLRNATTTTNGPQWNTGGVIDGAIEFEGGADIDNVNIPYTDDTSIEIAGDMTVAGWIKTGESAYGDIFHQTTSPEFKNYGFALASSGKLQLTHGNSTGPVDGATYYSNTTVNDDVWHHVAFVADYPNGHFYIDGVLDATVTMNFDITLSSGNNAYNFSNLSGSWNFVGLMDDFRVYDRALNARDMWALYDPGSTNLNAGCKLGAACTTEGAIDMEGGQLKSCNGTNYKVIAE